MSDQDARTVELQLKASCYRYLTPWSKANMPWRHYLIFAPFWFIVGIAFPALKAAFWNTFITVFQHIVYMPEKYFKLVKDVGIMDMPRWWYTTLVHENCHMSQQRDDGRWTFYWRYCMSRQRRFEYEIEAYLTELFLFGLLGHAPLENLVTIAGKLAKDVYMMKPRHLRQFEWEQATYKLVSEAQQFIANDRGFEEEIDVMRRAIGTEELIPSSLLLYQLNLVNNKRVAEASGHCRLPASLLLYLRFQIEEVYSDNR